MFLMYRLSPITCVLINVALDIYEDGTTVITADQGSEFKNQLNDEWKDLKLLTAVIVEHGIILTYVVSSDSQQPHTKWTCVRCQS